MFVNKAFIFKYFSCLSNFLSHEIREGFKEILDKQSSTNVVIVTVKQWLAELGNFERALKMMKDLVASKRLQQIKDIDIVSSLDGYMCAGWQA